MVIRFFLFSLLLGESNNNIVTGKSAMLYDITVKYYFIFC